MTSMLVVMQLSSYVKGTYVTSIYNFYTQIVQFYTFSSSGVVEAGFSDKRVPILDVTKRGK